MKTCTEMRPGAHATMQIHWYGPVVEGVRIIRWDHPATYVTDLRPCALVQTAVGIVLVRHCHLRRLGE